MMMHVGFTGTRRGMSRAQLDAVRYLLDEVLLLNGFIAHHGDCIGADEEFHRICREPRGGPVAIVIHPSTHHLRAFCEGDEVLDPMPPLERNRAIVAASDVMIAAPLDERMRGGTWATIRKARTALQRGRLGALYVIGRGGRLLDDQTRPL